MLVVVAQDIDISLTKTFGYFMTQGHPKFLNFFTLPVNGYQIELVELPKCVELHVCAEITKCAKLLVCAEFLWLLSEFFKCQVNPLVVKYLWMPSDFLWFLNIGGC